MQLDQQKLQELLGDLNYTANAQRESFVWHEIQKGFTINLFYAEELLAKNTKMITDLELFAANFAFSQFVDNLRWAQKVLAGQQLHPQKLDSQAMSCQHALPLLTEVWRSLQITPIYKDEPMPELEYDPDVWQRLIRSALSFLCLGIGLNNITGLQLELTKNAGLLCYRVSVEHASFTQQGPIQLDQLDPLSPAQDAWQKHVFLYKIVQAICAASGGDCRIDSDLQTQTKLICQIPLS